MGMDERMSGIRTGARLLVIASLVLAESGHAQQSATPPVASPAPAPVPAAPFPSAPAVPPASVQAMPPLPSAQAAPQAVDPLSGAKFGELVILTARPALQLSEKVKWDDVYSVVARLLEQLRGLVKTQDLKTEGAPMTQFVTVSDDIAEITVMLPLLQPPWQTAAIAPAKIGQTPEGSYYRFLHLGGYDTIGSTYDELANQLDEKNVEAEDRYVEEYVRDPSTTKPIDLATFIYVAGKASKAK
jgi:effector-binding domain-containing protein